MMKELKRGIEAKQAKIGVVGLGYVGLPLALEFARNGFNVVGIDINRAKVDGVNKGISHVTDISNSQIAQVVGRKKMKATADYGAIKEADVVIICVPTPLRKTKEPDLSYIVNAAESIAKHLKKGTLVSLESTTYPGTTQEMVLPILERRGFRLDRDFYLAFSPERIDPGNKQYMTGTIPKVIGGASRESSELAKSLYEKIIGKVVTVSSAKTAEMVKLLENSFRSVNIALANEMALICNKIGVDIWEVINAAKTKPFGFMPFYPGPGIGGECIPCDPLYLTWKARLEGLEPRFIELATQINSYMPRYVVERLADILGEHSKPLKGSRILVLGVTYKKDVSDTRESPAIEVLKILKEKGSVISYHDPYVAALRSEELNLKSAPLTPAVIKNQDCVAIITDHSSVDYGRVVKSAKLVFDTRNAIKEKSKKIIKL